MRFLTPGTVPSARASGWLLVICLLGGPSAHAQRLPLQADEQARVNRSVEAGVTFLRATQGPLGTWAAPRGKHLVGYAALPGLTLLECGVPSSDPAVQRAARLVRQGVPRLDATYEIALAILFLDRLGDPNDRSRIELLAVRLMAGQTNTGGWGYKCPVISKKVQNHILVALRQLDPLPRAVPVARNDPGQPVRPGAPLDRVVPLQPGRGEDPLGRVVGGKGRPLDGRVVPGEKDPSPPSPGESEGGAGIPELPDPDEAKEPAPAQTPLPSLSRPWPRCIKSVDPPTTDFEEDPAKPKKKARVEDVVPRGLRGLPIFNELPVPLVDPLKRERQPVLATTDNSNTQFAVLALWAAQRHGVPSRRSLDLIVRRFRTSQNANGTWGYRYKLGGGANGSAAMICVGLLGLAVGHGLEARREGVVPVDNAVVGGLKALTRHVGVPSAQPASQANLYLLWSIERVAVLYDLPTIGGKDWYRWAAGMLVAHQQPSGNWQGGGYPGAHVLPDTCFALLVLKKANLTRDLAARLPFDPGQVDRAVVEAITPPTPKEKSPPSAEENARRVTPPVQEPNPLQETPVLVGTNPPKPAEEGAPTTPEEGRQESSRVLGGMVFAAALLLLGVGIGCVVLHRQRGEEDEPDPEPRRRRRRA